MLMDAESVRSEAESKTAEAWLEAKRAREDATRAREESERLRLALRDVDSKLKHERSSRIDMEEQARRRSERLEISMREEILSKERMAHAALRSMEAADNAEKLKAKRTSEMLEAYKILHRRMSGSAIEARSEVGSQSAEALRGRGASTDSRPSRDMKQTKASASEDQGGWLGGITGIVGIGGGGGGGGGEGRGGGG